MSQSHGNTLWQEAAGAGGAPTPVPAYLVATGTDITWSVVGPETHAFANLSGSDYTLTPIGSIPPGTKRKRAVFVNGNFRIY